MKKISLLLVLSFWLLQLQAQTEEEVITNHIQHVGGETNWNKIKTITIDEKIESETGIIYTKRQIVKGKGFKNEFKFETRDTAYKNKTFYIMISPSGAWKKMPDAGSQPVRMTSAEVDLMRYEMDYEDPFLNYKEKGREIVFVDLVTENDIQYYKFFIKYETGEEYMCFMNSNDYMIHKITRQNSDIDDTRVYSNYEKLPEGIWMAKKIVSNEGESIIQSIKVNPKFPENLFATPPAPKTNITIKTDKK